METLINILSGLTAIDERAVNKINELSGLTGQYVLSSQVYSKDEIDSKLDKKGEDIAYLSSQIDNTNSVLQNSIASLNLSVSNLSSETSGISSFLLSQIISGANDIQTISSSLKLNNDSIQFLSAQISGNTESIGTLSSDVEYLSAKVQDIASGQAMSAYLQLKNDVLRLSAPREVSGIISACGFESHNNLHNLILNTSGIQLITSEQNTDDLTKNLFQLNIGSQNSLSGFGAATIGRVNKISGNFSVGLGQHLSGIHQNEVIIGRFNKPQEGLLFSIGNGTTNDFRSNAFTVDETGNGSFKASINAPQINLNGKKVNEANGLVKLNSSGKITSSFIDWKGVPIDFKSSDYLPISGGTMNGKLIASKGIQLSGTHQLSIGYPYSVKTYIDDDNFSITSISDIRYLLGSTQTSFTINVGHSILNYGKFLFSIGYSNVISGFCGEIVGSDNKISGNYSNIHGFSNTIYNDVNTINGVNNFIQGKLNYIQGLDNTIDGVQAYYNHIEGYSNTISSQLIDLLQYNFVHGTTNNVHGQFLNVYGMNNSVSGLNNTVIGQSNTVNGDYQFVLGHHLVNNGNIQHLFGQWNSPADSSKKFIEVIGWGSNQSNRKNIYLLDVNGNAMYSQNLAIGGNTTVNGSMTVSGRINSTNFLNWQPPSSRS